MAHIIEMSRIRQDGPWWLVEILSSSTGEWIIQGEFRTRPEAAADLKNWR